MGDEEKIVELREKIIELLDLVPDEDMPELWEKIQRVTAGEELDDFFDEDFDEE